MNIKHVGTGAMATLFTDVDTGEDYVVVQSDSCDWEHLYTVISVYDDLVVRNVDGATPEEGLRNYLELGDLAVAMVYSWYEYQDQGRERVIIDTIQRPGADKEYKARGTDAVYTVSWAGIAFRWLIFENGSDDYALVEAGTQTAAVVKHILDKEKREHNV